MGKHSTRQSVSCDKKIGFDNCTDVSNFPRQNYSRSDSHWGYVGAHLSSTNPFSKLSPTLFQNLLKPFFKTFSNPFSSFPMIGNLVAGIIRLSPRNCFEQCLIANLSAWPVNLVIIPIYVSRGGPKFPKLYIMS